MIKIVWCSVVLWLAAAGSAWAAAPAPSNPPEYVHTNVIPSVLAAKPGEPFDLYIEQLIEPGWHTYWKNPGDSGLALSVRWEAPAGTIISDLRFPIPERIAVPPLMNFGYSGRALYAVTVTPPKDLVGGTLSLTAQLDWLVCKDICLPENTFVTTTLPITTGTPVIHDKIADIQQDVTLSHPVTVNWPVTIEEGGGQVIVTFTPGENGARLIADGAKVEFFPEAWGVIANPSEQVLVRTDDHTVMMTIDRGDRALADVGSFPGLFVVTDGAGTRQGYQTIVTSSYAPQAPSAALEKPVTLSPPSVVETTAVETAMPMPTTIPAGPTILGILAIAVLGGLILNLMPCVFPVLSLKVLSLASLSGAEQREMRRHGLAYAAGVMAMFITMGAVLVALHAAGSAAGWGFQLQNPAVIAALVALFVFLGLNLMGWFEIDMNYWLPARWQSVDDSHSLLSSFLTGILATIVATPCTAPFMGAAMGFALTQSAPLALGVFAALGFGLALPFLILTFIPACRRVLPRPGAWMVTLREILAFPMFLTAVWLVWVLTQQTGANGVGLVGFAVLALVLALWTARRPTTKGWTLALKRLVVVGLIVLAGWSLTLQTPPATGSVVAPAKAYHQSFNKDALRQALATDQPIFVNLTAAWCITCKVNERVALNTDATRALFRDQKVIYLYGDWTNYDSEITDYLADHGRQGVPLYVFYGRPGAGGQRPAPVVLPQLLTETMIRETILTPTSGE